MRRRDLLQMIRLCFIDILLHVFVHFSINCFVSFARGMPDECFLLSCSLGLCITNKQILKVFLFFFLCFYSEKMKYFVHFCSSVWCVKSFLCLRFEFPQKTFQLFSLFLSLFLPQINKPFFTRPQKIIHCLVQNLVNLISSSAATKEKTTHEIFILIDFLFCV